MDFIIGLILLIIVAVFIAVYLLYKILSRKLRVLLGYKLYEYTKILSHGMANEYMWHKSDETALEHHKHFEFVSEVKPNKRRLRPLN